MTQIVLCARAWCGVYVNLRVALLRQSRRRAQKESSTKSMNDLRSK